MEELFENLKISKSLCEKCHLFTKRFNTKGEKKALYCTKCKEPGMVNVLDKRICIWCKKRHPSFNLPGEKELYCGKCILDPLVLIPEKDRMINVKAKGCSEDGCRVLHPYFGIPGNRPDKCSKHRTPDMIDLYHVKCIWCLELGIENPVNASFNFPSEKKNLYCFEHAEDGMVNKSSRGCQFPDCVIKQALFNFEKQKSGKFCSTHREPGMINVYEKRYCPTPLCYTIGQEKFKNHCLRCFVLLFPEHKLARNYKTKERSVYEFLCEQFPEITFRYDKIVPDGCTNKRPDIFVDFGTHIVIVEIDEDQHRNYDTSCENKRMMEISVSVGHRPIVFIRFNPDSYKLPNNKTIPSCWKLNKANGICMIGDRMKWQERLDVLARTFQEHMKLRDDKMITILHLFFNINP
jgi:hypothetical protein